MYYQLVLKVKDSGLNKGEFELCVLDENNNIVCTSKEA